MGSIKSYRELIVWQKSMALARTIYDLTRCFPTDEKFGLTSQMRRATVSIPANIAEGQARNTTGEFRQSLGIANGSLAELETLILLSANLDYLSKDDAEPLLVQCKEVARLLAGLLKSLSTDHCPLTTDHCPLTTIPQTLFFSRNVFSTTGRPIG